MRQLLSGRGRRGGFALIDLLVAAVLLAVAILFVSIIFPVRYFSMDAGGEVTEAAVLAEHMPEKIKSAGGTTWGTTGAAPMTAAPRRYRVSAPGQPWWTPT
ncbi:MAG: hypothetical protein ACREJ7_04165 [Candidatus Methylomirabilales bacterium]